MDPLDSSDLYQNATVLKIRNGTAREDKNLCTSCRFSHIYVDAQREERTILCTYGREKRQNKGPISECNQYSDRTKPTLDDMNEIAWQLMTNKGGRSVGFLSPEDLKQRGKASTGFM